MTWLTTAVGLGLLLVSPMFAGEHSAFARVTVYWSSEGSGANAAWDGARLRDGYCAVDPKKIPYGSQVVFHDAVCKAVDTGPDVVNRKAARLCGRSGAERNAIVIDRFFETKQNALAWAKANPHFMVVQIRTPDIQTVSTTRQRNASVTKLSSPALNCVNELLATSNHNGEGGWWGLGWDLAAALGVSVVSEPLQIVETRQ